MRSAAGGLRNVGVWFWKKIGTVDRRAERFAPVVCARLYEGETTKRPRRSKNSKRRGEEGAEGGMAGESRGVCVRAGLCFDFAIHTMLFESGGDFPRFTIPHGCDKSCMDHWMCAEGSTQAGETIPSISSWLNDTEVLQRILVCPQNS